MSRLTAWKMSDWVMLGVISVVVPPESLKPTLILLPVLLARISKLIAVCPERLIGTPIDLVRVLLRDVVA